MTNPVAIEVHTVPASYDLSHWRDVIAVTHNGAYWPVAVAYPTRSEIVQRALQMWSDTDPNGLIEAIYESMSDPS